MHGAKLLSLVAAVLASTASALTPITVKGNAFFAGNDRFYVRGVAYQPGGPSKLTDPLADTTICKRDIPLFKELGINAIRVYTIDNSKNHDECMKALADAGIYLILDVNTPTRSLHRTLPWTTYNEIYMQHVFATIDVMSKYDNLMAFFTANEVVNDEKTTAAATYVKAVTRDIKRYIKERVKRPIPVGYSAADVAENRWEIMQYLDCGDDNARSDFFAFNDYSWCADATFKTSGWDQKVKKYADYPVPIFLSEFGCNEVMPRKWNEIASIYGPDMTAVFSGGLAYEYTMEENNYGLVEIKGGKVTKLEDFDTLKAQYAKTKNPTGAGGFKTNGKKSTCPPFVAGAWEANNTLPSIPPKAEVYFKNGAGKPLGNPEAPLPADGEKPEDTDSSDTSGDEDKEKEDDKSAANTLSLRISGTVAGVMAVAVFASLL